MTEGGVVDLTLTSSTYLGLCREAGPLAHSGALEAARKTYPARLFSGVPPAGCSQGPLLSIVLLQIWDHPTEGEKGKWGKGGRRCKSNGCVSPNWNACPLLAPRNWEKQTQVQNSFSRAARVSTAIARGRAPSAVTCGSLFLISKEIFKLHIKQISETCNGLNREFSLEFQLF